MESSIPFHNRLKACKRSLSCVGSPRAYNGHLFHDNCRVWRIMLIPRKYIGFRQNQVHTVNFCPSARKLQWWPDEILRQKRFLLCINNHWKYENKQYTIEKPYKIATRNAKFFFDFFKICWFFGPFLKKLCFGKMGRAGIKWGQRSSTIPPFLMNLNEEALLKVSFKNIDWFQICPFSKTTAFSKKALKTNKFWKIQFFFAFLVAFL